MTGLIRTSDKYTQISAQTSFFKNYSAIEYFNFFIDASPFFHDIFTELCIEFVLFSLDTSPANSDHFGSSLTYHWFAARKITSDFDETVEDKNCYFVYSLDSARSIVLI